MLHTLRFFFSSKCRLFYNASFFGSCVIHTLYTGCAKIKKKSDSKGLNLQCQRPSRHRKMNYMSAFKDSVRTALQNSVPLLLKKIYNQ